MSDPNDEQEIQDALDEWNERGREAVDDWDGTPLDQGEESDD